MTYGRSTWLFLRLLGFVYLVAFWSLGLQIRGIVGHDGILPAADIMAAVGQVADRRGMGMVERVAAVPTIFWLTAGDTALTGACAVGSALGFLLMLGVAPMLVLPLLWMAYLSVAVVCSEFLSYQWDALLLETGFLAIFVAPLGWFTGFSIAPRTARGTSHSAPGTALRTPHPALRTSPDPCPVARWLLWWLLFRLMFASGVVKLRSGDPTWRGLTAMTVHYETQPIPTPVGWWAHHLPFAFQKMSTAVVLGVELLVPFLIFLPRRFRTVGCVVLIGLQVLVALTGNYAFFNLLTVSLCVLLLDDRTIGRILQLRTVLQSASAVRSAPAPPTPPALPALPAAPALPAPPAPPDPPDTPDPPGLQAPRRGWPRWVPIGAAALTVPVSVVILSRQLGIELPGSVILAPLEAFVEPFHSVNGYGLFAVMTTTRPEIIVQGSDDQLNWRTYEFKYKPGDVRRRPPWVAPHQPRLDWQMWFAALGSYEQATWFESFSRRLLEGSPSVLGLLAANPFPQKPPRFVRAVLYRYQVADLETHRREGVWWVREEIGPYSPVLTLQGS